MSTTPPTREGITLAVGKEVIAHPHRVLIGAWLECSRKTQHTSQMVKPRASTKKSPGDNDVLAWSMKLRVYPSKGQTRKVSQWLYWRHRFRNEAVAWLKEQHVLRAKWIAKHPALARDEIPEELSGSIGLCSKWLTARLEAARNTLRLEAGISAPKKTLGPMVFGHWQHLTKAERKSDTWKDAWLLALPRTILDQVLQDLGKTLSKAINDRKNKTQKPAGFPGFRKFSYASSIRLQVEASKNTDFREHWNAGELFVPGLRRLKFKDANFVLPSTPPKLITLMRDAAGNFHVAFTCVAGESKASRGRSQQNLLLAMPLDPLTGFPKVSSLDLGVSSRSTDQDGKKSGRTKHLRKFMRRMRRQNKTLSRRKKGSGRWLRAKVELGRTHVKIANCREALLRQEAREIVQANAIVCLETLFLGFMLQNQHLAQSAHDAALGRFQVLIEQECIKHGHLLLRCGRFDASTKTCSACQQVNPNLTLKDRTWTCPGCKTRHDRDHNAAINIRRMALDRAIRELPVPENGVGKISSHRLKPDLEAFIARGGLTTLSELYRSGERRTDEACASPRQPTRDRTERARAG